MSKKTIISLSYLLILTKNETYPFSLTQRNKAKVHIESYLNCNRYDWQEGKGADDVEQFCGNPYAFVVLHDVCESKAMLLPTFCHCNHIRVKAHVQTRERWATYSWMLLKFWRNFR